MAAVTACYGLVLGACLWAVAAISQTSGVHAKDDTGAIVELAAPARRIVSLAPHATELLFAAGAGGAVVAVVARSDHPREARALPVIGDVQTLDLERIAALRPDLVVTWPYTTPAQVARLKARGIAVYTTDPARVEGIADNIVALGVLAGTRETAIANAAALRARIARQQVAAVGKPVLRVFYQIWDAPVFTVGGRHLITQALAICGGENVMSALPIPAPQVSIEAVLAAQPDVIVAGADGAQRPDWLDVWRRWSQLPAVRYGNLDVVDADHLHRPGPRFIEGLEKLCDVLDRARERREAKAAALRRPGA